MTTIARISLGTLMLAAVSAGLTGCGMSSPAKSGSTVSTGSPATAKAMTGRVFGGQQPVSGATVQIYAASTAGYGAAATALIPAGSYSLGGAPGCSPQTDTCYASVLTTANGGFDVSSDYTCPSDSALIYLVATGGNPGSGGSTVNSGLILMLALGACGPIKQNPPSVTLNELTTVASVWALAPFLSGYANLGTSAANVQGLSNAFATASKLVNIHSGTVSGSALPPAATVPVTKLNTLADILASCVNTVDAASAPAVVPSSNCSSLYAYTAVNGVQPADTVGAALNMAKYPNMQTANLTGMAGAFSPFQPIVSAVPADFSLVITYSGGGLSAPKSIAADASGNLWVANPGNNTVTKLDALGVTPTDAQGFLSGATGFTVGALSTPSAIAIDTGGNAWVANSGNSTVTEINAAGTTGTVYMGGFNAPNSLAIDGAGNIWVANQSTTGVTQISATGSLTNFNRAGIQAPTAIVIDPK